MLSLVRHKGSSLVMLQLPTVGTLLTRTLVSVRDWHQSVEWIPWVALPSTSETLIQVQGSCVGALGLGRLIFSTSTLFLSFSVMWQHHRGSSFQVVPICSQRHFICDFPSWVVPLIFWSPKHSCFVIHSAPYCLWGDSELIWWETDLKTNLEETDSNLRRCGFHQKHLPLTYLL